MASIAEPDRHTGPLARHVGVLAALGAATVGFAFGEAVSKARTSDAFLIAPSLTRIGTYVVGLLLLAGLAIALQIGGPPLAARGGKAARQVRAMIRRRFRHGRSRAEIAKVENGLTVSLCLVLVAFGLALAAPKAILVVAVTAGLVLTVQGLLTLCQLAAFAPRWCGAMGFLYGLGAGWLLG